MQKFMLPTLKAPRNLIRELVLANTNPTHDVMNKIFILKKTIVWTITSVYTLSITCYQWKAH